MSSTELPAVLVPEAADTADEAQAASRAWVETAIAVAFAAAAVLFVSFIAVVTVLV